MKKRLATGYTFDASAKTIVHADFSDITLEGIQVITNVTDNIIIYNFADPAKGGTLATDTLTLVYDTTSMDDTDKLMILVEDGIELINDISNDLVTIKTHTEDIVANTADIADVAANTTTIAGAVAGTEMQVDVVGSLPAGTAAIGGITGAGSNAQIKDDSFYAEDVTSGVLSTHNRLWDGAAYDRAPGNSTNGALVNLGTNNDVIASGDVAAGSADSGNPVKVGGKYNSTQPTLTDGQRGDLQLTSRGEARVSVSNGATTAAINTGADGASAASGLVVNGRTQVYNGASWDLMRGDTTNGVDVDVTRLPALVAGTAAVGKLLPPNVDVTTNAVYTKKYYTNAGAVTDGIIWSPASGTRWHIHTIAINVSAAATVTLEDDKAGGDEAIWKAELAANSGIVMTFPEKYPWASGEDAADLIITTSAGNVYVSCSGYEV